MTGKRRGRVSFADNDFAETTSLTTLPDSARTPTWARLDELAHRPGNPRDGYSGETFDELVESLRIAGQLQPATVVGRDVYLAHFPDAADEVGDARYVVVMGNRRLAAARAAGLERLDITVKDHLAGTNPRVSEAALMENLHRESVPPLLEARELAALVEEHGSQSAVAERLAKTPAWVSQRISLLKLTAELQEQLRAGELSFREARGLTATAPEEQPAKLAEMRGQRPEPAPAPTASPAAEAEEPTPRGEPPRRGRPRRAHDVDTIARDLRRKLSDDELARLVERLHSELGS